jgi:hypothetical protein
MLALEKPTKAKGERELHPGGNRGRHPPLGQRAAGGVERDEGGGAGGVDRRARAAQVEDVGQPVREDRERVAGHEVAVGARMVGQPHLGIVGGGAADEDADLLPREAGGREAGILEGLGRHLEQQALLRVHLRRLARGDAEGGAVEARDVADRAGGEGVGPARLAAARMVEGRLGEAVGRQRRDRVGARGEQPPERVGIGRPGQAEPGAEDGDRDRIKAGAAGRSATGLRAMGARGPAAVAGT